VGNRRSLGRADYHKRAAALEPMSQFGCDRIQLLSRKLDGTKRDARDRKKAPGICMCLRQGSRIWTAVSTSRDGRLGHRTTHNPWNGTANGIAAPWHGSGRA